MRTASWTRTGIEAALALTTAAEEPLELLTMVSMAPRTLAVATVQCPPGPRDPLLRRDGRDGTGGLLVAEN